MGTVINHFFKTRGGVFLYTIGGTVLAGSGVLYCSEKRKKWMRKSDKPPERLSAQYICGQNSGYLVADNKLLHQQFFFYIYILYRVAILSMRLIPVLWFALLTYTFGICPEDFFSSQLLNFFTLMGPTYTKLGQWMATRPDVFPPNLCKSLQCLYDSVEPHRWKYTKNVLEKSYIGTSTNALPIEESKKSCKRPVLDFLDDIKQVAINSGSIAQIHTAKLKEEIDNIPQGTKVALKVVHPNVRQTFAADLASMKLFVQLLDIILPDIRLFNLKVSLREFELLVTSQLDLRIECDNLLQFAYNFRSFPGVIFPKPLPSLVSQDLLVETFEEGEPLTHFQFSDNNEDLAKIGCHMLMKMLFEDNFVHSDLHPGNILVRTNQADSSSQKEIHCIGGMPKKKRELIILDAGLAMSLSERNRYNFISLFAAVACGEGEWGANLMLERLPSVKNSCFCSSNIDLPKFRSDMKKIFDQVSPHASGFKLSNIQIGKILLDIMSTLRENNVPLDGSFSSLVLTVIVGEGLGRRLAPGFNLFAEASPYLVSYLEAKQLSALSRKIAENYCGQSLRQKSSIMELWNKAKVILLDIVAHLKDQTEKFFLPEGKKLLN